MGWGLLYESPHEREYKTVLDTGSNAMNWSEFWISLVDFGFFVSGTWKPDCTVSGIPNSLSCIPDSNYKKALRIPDSTS